MVFHSSYSVISGDMLCYQRALIHSSHDPFRPSYNFAHVLSSSHPLPYHPIWISKPNQTNSQAAVIIYRFPRTWWNKPSKARIQSIPRSSHLLTLKLTIYKQTQTNRCAIWRQIVLYHPKTCVTASWYSQQACTRYNFYSKTKNMPEKATISRRLWKACSRSRDMPKIEKNVKPPVAKGTNWTISIYQGREELLTRPKKHKAPCPVDIKTCKKLDRSKRTSGQAVQWCIPPRRNAEYSVFSVGLIIVDHSKVDYCLVPCWWPRSIKRYSIRWA